MLDVPAGESSQRWAFKLSYTRARAHTHAFKGHTSSFPLPAIAAPPHERSGALIPMLINNCINYAAWE